MRCEVYATAVAVAVAVAPAYSPSAGKFAYRVLQIYMRLAEHDVERIFGVPLRCRLWMPNMISRWFLFLRNSLAVPVPTHSESTATFVLLQVGQWRDASAWIPSPYQHGKPPRHSATPRLEKAARVIRVERAVKAVRLVKAVNLVLAVSCKYVS